LDGLQPVVLATLEFAVAATQSAALNEDGTAPMSAKPSDNVILLEPAAAALRDAFIGWQCRIRQLSARQAGGRPSAGMRPRVSAPQGEEIAPAVTLLISEQEPQANTTLFRFQFLKNQDPAERYDKILEILSAGYFQQPHDFGDVMTGLFGPQSTVAATLLNHGRCILDFAEYAQAYRIPSAVAALTESDDLYQATYWHNRMFNPNMPPAVRILSFTPDWPHAAAWTADEA
jgi:hypothetical protein